MPNPEIDHVEIKGTTYDVAGSGGAVTSVNGQTGAVVLDADDVGALPDDTSIPSKTSDLNNDSGFITSSDIPVTSVNSKTGAVSLSASDVGALPSSTTIPTKVSDLQNDSGYITTETDPTVPSWAKASTKPSYTAQEVGALPSSTSIPSNTSDLNNDSGFITSSDIPVTSVNSQTGAVTLSIPDSTSDLQNDSGFVSSQQTEKIFVQGTTPSTASDGDIWIDTATQSASGIAYLPLSAGENHPLTGDVIFEEEGTPVGYIHKNQYGVSYNSMDSNGDMCGGIFSNITNGSTYVYGSGGQVVFRPYGVADSTAQVFINSSGQIQGGITVYEGTGTTPHNYSGSEVNVNTTILSTSSLPSGKYIIAGYLSLAFSSSTSGQMYINLFHDTTAIVYDLNMFTSRASYYKTIFYPYEGSGVIKLCLDSNVASTVRGSLTVWRIG